jgi:hypothetical protein
MNIKSLVADFAGQLSSLIHNQATERARAAVMSAFGVAPRRGPGRPPKAAAAKATVVAPVAKKARKKAPRQLCPVPGCKNPSAPIFGMVCAKHKDLPKAKIKAYREARRAKKLGLPVPKAGKRKATKKPAAKVGPKKVFSRRGPKKPAKLAVAPQPVATPIAA